MSHGVIYLPTEYAKPGICKELRCKLKQLLSQGTFFQVFQRGGVKRDHIGRICGKEPNQVVIEIRGLNPENALDNYNLFVSNYPEYGLKQLEVR